MWERLIEIFAARHEAKPDDKRAVKFVPDGYNSWRIVWADDQVGYGNGPDAKKSFNCTDLSHKIFNPEARLSTRSVIVIWDDHLISDVWNMKRRRA